MPQITLPDNSKRSYDQPISIDEVARDIGSGLAKATVAGKINGKLVDASETITEDCNCLLYTSPSPRDLYRSRMPSSA